jgi:predicted nucleic acid-binding protein
VEILDYLLDTNVIGDAMRRQPHVVTRYASALTGEHALLLCPAVHYEVVRGLLKSGATAQYQRYQTEFVSTVQWTPFESSDWDRAAQLWATARNRGRQLSDMDLLLAAMAIRLDAILVTADEDFSALPVKRENWRE